MSAAASSAAVVGPNVVAAGKLGIIAGSGVYPLELCRAARSAGVASLAIAAFEGETRKDIAQLADHIEWMRVGQLTRLVKFFGTHRTEYAVMAGQIAPGNLFELRPDWRALLLLGRLKRRNAESIFGAIADELAASGVQLIDARTFLEDDLASEGVLAGGSVSRRELEDIRFGMEIAREISRLDIGQTVVVRHGTVLAVEGFDGTNETIRRGGALGRGKAVVVKVSKPAQDFRFDVPVVGERTIEVCRDAGVRVLAVEAERTLLLERDKIERLALEFGIALYGVSHE